jgi:hypothetical protein
MLMVVVFFVFVIVFLVLTVKADPGQQIGRAHV